MKTVTEPAPATIASRNLVARIHPRGAELWSLTGPDGREWLWQGDPRFWSGRAPILFPVIGKSPGGTVPIGGEACPMPAHGIARTSLFELVAADPGSCRFRLQSSAETWTQYPFAFTLEIAFSVLDATLAMEARVHNRGDVPMPFCLGFHPAFAWPLPGAEGASHRLRLVGGGSPRHRRLDDDGMIGPAAPGSLFVDGALALSHEFFEAGALIYDSDFGNGATYGPEAGPSITMFWDGARHLGVWTKPQAPFLCLEPWRGLPPEPGGDAELFRRPGVEILAPGATSGFVMTVTLSPG